MNTMFTHRIEPKVDLANGVAILDEFERNPLIDHSPTKEILERHFRSIVDTRDKAIRAALIRLGWTPPAEPAPAGQADAPVTDELRRRVRAHDPASSVIAAERAAEFAGSHKERILRALREDELSSHQIARLSGLTVVQVDRRLIELERERSIEVVVVDGEELLRAGYRVWRRVRSSKS